jgi:hypothetical protein
MSAKDLVLILALAASAITVVYATQRPAAEEPVPAAEGVAIPQIVIVAKREHVADQHR